MRNWMDNNRTAFFKILLDKQ